MVADAALTGGRWTPLAVAAGGLGAAFLLGGLLLRWPVAIALAVLLSGGAYLVGREGRGLVDGWASLVGVALLVSAELAHWSIGHDSRISSERSLVLRRVATLVALALAALALDFVLLATSAFSASSGVLLATVGVAASVAAVAVALRLLRPAGTQEPQG